jgi:hypothetical protein
MVLRAGSEYWQAREAVLEMVVRSHGHVMMQSLLLVRPNLCACEEGLSPQLAEASSN